MESTQAGTSAITVWTIEVRDVNGIEMLALEDKLRDGGFYFYAFRSVPNAQHAYVSCMWSVDRESNPDDKAEVICETVWREVKRYVPVSLVWVECPKMRGYEGLENSCNAIFAAKDDRHE